MPFYDRTQLVDVTTSTVLHNLVFGCVLIFFIQWIFLGDLRSAIIVGANIPFALFFSIIILVLRGEDANLLSVGAIDFGIIVDAAVIVVENIYRNFQARPQDSQALLRQLAEGKWGRDPTRGSDFSSAGLDRPAAAHPGERPAGRSAVFFSTAIIVAAFIPLFTMQGVEGQIFGPMARTYAYALVGALIATFTVTPCLASLHRPGADRGSRDHRRAQAARRLHAGAALVAGQPQDHRRDRAGLSRRLAAFSDRGSAANSCRRSRKAICGFAPRCRRPYRSKPACRSSNKIREILLRHPEVITVVSQHGRPDDGSDAAGFFNAEFFVPLKPFDEWPTGLTKDKLIDELQTEFDNEFVGIDFNFSQYIQDNVEEGLSGVKGANSAKIIGPDLATLEKIAKAAMHEMAQVQGITDLGAFWVLGQPNLNIRVDRAKAARYGLSVNDVNNVVQAALGGTTATTLLEADRQFDVVVRLAPAFRKNIDDVRNLKIGVQTSDRQRLYSLERACLDLARHRRLLYLPRAQPALRADQVQRARPRSRRRRRGSAAAHRGEREAADRLSHRMVRRIRMAAAGQAAACGHPADHARPDHDPALHAVQFVARHACWRCSDCRSRFAAAFWRSTSPDWISASRRRSDSSRCSASR